jgi:hypothetical protein
MYIKKPVDKFNRLMNYYWRGGKPAFSKAETIRPGAAELSTVTDLFGGSVTILASGSTSLMALVTPRAQPPHVIFSICNCIMNSLVEVDSILSIDLPMIGRSSVLVDNKMKQYKRMFALH